jgi:hypothetical protein
MANVENKFRIILADRATMREQFPLSRQQEIVNQAGSAVFFVEAYGDSVSPEDVKRQINDWNKGNIIGIMIHGFVTAELMKDDSENSKKFGVPVVSVGTNGKSPIGSDQIL